jgi:serine/threonine protein kinase
VSTFSGFGHAIAIKSVSLATKKQTATGKRMVATSEDALKQEVFVATFCQHPNIVKLLGLTSATMPCQPDWVGNRTVLLYELCSGDLLNPPDDMELNHAVECLAGVAEGLGHMHLQQWLHCDVKPENMFFIQQAAGFIGKIADLGSALQMPVGSLHVVSSGSTTGYQAPELLLLRTKDPMYTVAADVYAFGISLWVVLTNNSPEDLVRLLKGKTPAAAEER